MLVSECSIWNQKRHFENKHSVSKDDFSICPSSDIVQYLNHVFSSLSLPRYLSVVANDDHSIVDDRKCLLQNPS